MTWISDLIAGGYSPRQHFDPQYDLNLRLVRFSARVERNDLTNDRMSIPARTAGDELGWTLWEPEGTNRLCSAWAAHWPATVYSAAPSTTAPTTGTSTVKSSPLPLWSAVPLGTNSTPDDRFEPKFPDLPHWASRPPVGWTGTVGGASAENLQRETWHPDFLGLVASNRGDRGYSTQVFDLARQTVDPNWSAPLHSVFSVEEPAIVEPGFAVVPNASIVALQLGSSGADDLHNPMLATYRYAGDKQVLALGTTGGGPLTFGASQNDPHEIGRCADWSPLMAGHLSTLSLFRTNGTPHDGPIRFEGAASPPRPPASENLVPCHVLFNPQTPYGWYGKTLTGMWEVWAEVPFFQSNTQTVVQPPPAAGTVTRTPPPPTVPGGAGGAGGAPPSGGPPPPPPPAGGGAGGAGGGGVIFFPPRQPGAAQPPQPPPTSPLPRPSSGPIVRKRNPFGGFGIPGGGGGRGPTTRSKRQEAREARIAAARDAARRAREKREREREARAQKRAQKAKERQSKKDKINEERAKRKEELKRRREQEEEIRDAQRRRAEADKAMEEANKRAHGEWAKRYAESDGSTPSGTSTDQTDPTPPSEEKRQGPGGSTTKGVDEISLENDQAYTGPYADTKYAIFPGGLGLFGAAFKPSATGSGHRDYSVGGPLSATDQRILAEVPNVASLQAYAANPSGAWNGWTYTVKPGLLGGPAAQGGVIFGSPTVPAKAYLAGYTGNTTAATWLTFPRGSKLGFGCPDGTTGAIKRGVGIGVTPEGYLDLIPYNDLGVASTTSKLRVTSSGTTVTGKLTVTDLIDPTGLVLEEQASDPMSGAQVGLYAGDTAGANEAWWRRDDGSLVDLASGSGTGAKARRLLYSWAGATGSKGNVGTGEDTLDSYDVADGTLAANGDALDIHASGTIDSSSNGTIKAYIDGTAIGFAVGAYASTAQTFWRLQAKAVRSASGTVQVSTHWIWHETAATTSAAEVHYHEQVSYSGAITILITGQNNGSSDDNVVQLRSFTVEYTPAP